MDPGWDSTAAAGSVGTARLILAPLGRWKIRPVASSVEFAHGTVVSKGGTSFVAIGAQIPPSPIMKDSGYPAASAAVERHAAILGKLVPSFRCGQRTRSPLRTLHQGPPRIPAPPQAAPQLPQ